MTPNRVRAPGSSVEIPWELFLEQAQRHADRTALIAESGTWTFGTLAARAALLADELTELGVGPGDIVAILSSRTPEMVMAMVAIALAGAAYLPIDSDQPAERVRGMLEDAQARLVLADAAGEAIAGDGAPIPRGRHRGSTVPPVPARRR